MGAQTEKSHFRGKQWDCIEGWILSPWVTLKFKSIREGYSPGSSWKTGFFWAAACSLFLALACDSWATKAGSTGLMPLPNLKILEENV